MGKTVVTAHSREQLAWGVLLSGCAVFLLVLITIPVGVNAFLQRSMESVDIFVTANQGAVTVNEGQGVQQAVLPEDEPKVFSGLATIRTASPGNAFVHFAIPEATESLVRVHLFATTSLAVQEAITPRFARSRNETQFDLQLELGQLQLSVMGDSERPFLFNISTPHGRISIEEPGEYNIDVTAVSTQIVAQSGQLTLSTTDQSLILQANQRAELFADGTAQGPFMPQANLIPNGTFAIDVLAADAAWQRSGWNVERPDQPIGELRQWRSAESASVRLTRSGLGHADIQFQQQLDQPVPDDIGAMWLRLQFKLYSHSLEVCGFQGSECPFFVKIEYEDENGALQNWQQGFYVVSGMGGIAPYTCTSCGIIQGNHEQVVANEITTYEISMAEIGRLGPQPHLIKNITLVFSGHSFDAEINEAALFEVGESQ